MIPDEQLAAILVDIDAGAADGATFAALDIGVARSLIEDIRRLAPLDRPRPLNHPRVVNLNRWKHVDPPADVARVDRKTKFGNPFPLDRDATVSVIWPRRRAVNIATGMPRELSVALHRAWLAEKLRHEPTFLDPLAGMRLACHCDPLLCHATNIAELQQEGGRG